MRLHSPMSCQYAPFVSSRPCPAWLHLATTLAPGVPGNEASQYGVGPTRCRRPQRRGLSSILTRTRASQALQYAGNANNVVKVSIPPPIMSSPLSKPYAEQVATTLHPISMSPSGSRSGSLLDATPWECPHLSAPAATTVPTRNPACWSRGWHRRPCRRG
jgi:hypothetical protein